MYYYDYCYNVFNTLNAYNRHNEKYLKLYHQNRQSAYNVHSAIYVYFHYVTEVLQCSCRRKSLHKDIKTLFSSLSFFQGAY